MDTPKTTTIIDINDLMFFVPMMTQEQKNELLDDLDEARTEGRISKVDYVIMKFILLK